MSLVSMSQNKKNVWSIARRELTLGERTLIMGILNLTPDSFSDGGMWNSLEKALAHAEKMVAEGVDIIDVGGESTRPGALPVTVEEELNRVVPIIENLVKRIEVPLSIDTTKASVARAALEAGAEIVNDISGLRFESHLAYDVARMKAGLILMHSRGTAPQKLHGLDPVENIMEDVELGWKESISKAVASGVSMDSIVLDPGIGFGKTEQQNVELIAKLDQLAETFDGIPVLVGTSRKSFIGKLLGNVPVEQRLHGTMATITVSIMHGAKIIRVHDVRAAIETARIADVIKNSKFLF
jgi:dihydropteroate synthase